MPSLGTKYSLVRLEPRALSLSRSLPVMVQRRFGSRVEEGEKFTSTRKSCSGPTSTEGQAGKEQKAKGEAGRGSDDGRKMLLERTTS